MKLDVRDLSFLYGDKMILDSISFSINKGEFVSVLGPSGAGKSTILKLLTGVLKPYSGKIILDEKEINGISESFSYMPQNDLLFPWKTILENVCLYAKIHNQYESVKNEALSHFESFGINGYENEYPSSLSGGMRQRAAFLRTLLCKSDILLLDEPFGALDVITRGEMQDWLISVREKMDRTILLVTHDIDEAIYLSDRILILSKDGKGISQEIIIDEKNKNRNWLYKQGELRMKIHESIMGNKV